MLKVTLLTVAVILVSGAGAHAQSAAAETELAQLVADCNGMADSRAAKRRNIRACEALASEERLSLVEPTAAAAYRQYQEERFQACQRRRASPRGASRGPSDCEP